MIQIQKVRYFFNIIILLFIINIFIAPALFSQNTQEIEVTIGGISSSEKIVHFHNGEELRKKMKFGEAISAYMQVISSGELCGKEAEAHYNIGICYTWLGKINEAETIFNDVIEAYKENNKILAYSTFGLSWIDVQRKNFKQAINRLQQTLDKNMCTEEEFSSRALFEIGRIYMAYMHDYDTAKIIFQEVLQLYPNSKIINHPFLKNI